jgi:tight adherence protein B
VVQAAASAGRRGEDIAEAIVRAARTLSDEDARAWLSLAAAWAVATAAGSPMAPCLRLLAESFRDLGQLQRDLQVALAGPAATARLVMALPLVGVLFGALMGFNTVATLLGTTPGLACLAIGSALLFVGRRWNARLVRGARAVDAAPGLGFELTAIAMTGGASVSRARALVRSAEEQYGIGGASADTAIERVLDLSARAGVPAVELLRSEAAQQRREARAVGQRKAATLGVTLMIPLALCVLPAFMVVGVMPLLLSVLSSTFGEL